MRRVFIEDHRRRTEQERFRRGRAAVYGRVYLVTKATSDTSEGKAREEDGAVVHDDPVPIMRCRTVDVRTR